MIIKQRITLAHIDGMSNRAIANILHLSKDNVNKYANEEDAKREELLKLNRDKRLIDMYKQTMKKIDIYTCLKKKGFDVSYSTNTSPFNFSLSLCF